MKLEDIIIQKIREEGALPFREYMEMCLYYPGLGYYTSSKDRIGRNGDYYTSGNIYPGVGAVIGRQLEEMWSATGKGEFTVVEYGAGTGMLCHDILDYLKNNRAFYSRLRYCIIEKSPAMREKEKRHLKEKVSWHESLRDIGPFTGCVLSNELLDNFSVHVVVMKERMMEVFVDYRDGFVESLQPAGKELVNYMDELNVTLPSEFRTEINLEATKWIGEIAMTLKKGYVLTIDYGYRSPQLYHTCRSNGTLLCYYHHTINDEPFAHIGEQDITAHVNFSALSHWGSKYGLVTEGFTSQGAFLVALGWENQLNDILARPREKYLNLREYAFLKYTMLVDMGQKFKVLLQSKGVSRNKLFPFSGLFNRKN